MALPIPLPPLNLSSNDASSVLSGGTNSFSTGSMNYNKGISPWFIGAIVVAAALSFYVFNKRRR